MEPGTLPCDEPKFIVFFLWHAPIVVQHVLLQLQES